jgi:hypothetical protein
MELGGGRIKGYRRRRLLLHQLWSERTHFRPVLEEPVWESRGQAEHFSVTPGESASNSPIAPCWSHVCIHFFLQFSPSLQHKALVDSGAAGNFMDRGLARKLGIPLVPIETPFPVHSLDIRPLGSGLVREAMVPLDILTQEDHKERISLFLIDSPAFPVVLGVPWISWKQGSLQGWSEECSGRCMGVSIGATSVGSSDQVYCAHSL